MSAAPEFAFYSTPVFDKWVRKNRLGSAVGKLKAEIEAAPETGDVIPGYGGLRKIRMGGQGRGKSGGFRVVYFLLLGRTAAALMRGYAKSETENLPDDELKRLAASAAEFEAALEAARQSQPQPEDDA